MSRFDISSDTAVVTSTYVVNDKMPILYVSHEYDDEDGPIWQFHCGNDVYGMDKMLLVSLEGILGVDKSIREVADLPMNFVARRQHVGDAWVYSEA